VCAGRSVCVPARRGGPPLSGGMVRAQFGNEFGLRTGDLASVLELCATNLGSRIASIVIGDEESGYPASHVSEAQWIAFFAACSNIVEMLLTSAYKATDRVLLAIAFTCPKTRSIKMSGNGRRTRARTHTRTHARTHTHTLTNLDKIG
jgi:hypothetical protein